MAGLLGLLGQCLAMFIASFAVGYIPLGFKSALSGRPLKAISVFGMGLLVGAALTVIIPEGITTLYGALPSGSDAKEQTGDPTLAIGISLLTGFALMMLVEALTPHGPHEESSASSASTSNSASAPSSPTLEGDDETLPRFADNPAPQTQAYPSVQPYPYPNDRQDSSTALFHGVQGGSNGHPGGDIRSKPKSFHTLSFSGSNGEPPLRVPPNNRRRTTGGVHYHSSHHISHPDYDPENRCQEAEGGAKGTGVAGLNATIGLVTHGLSDGISLGASSLSESSSLSAVVFLAVIIHKGPTALGLTTTLLSLGLDPSAIRRRLFVFSAAAPVGAIVTYFLVSLFGGGMGGFKEVAEKEVTDRLGYWTGVVLLFSGGSFLYVATVISPLSPSSSHDRDPEAEKEELSKTFRLCLLLGGMTLPLIMGAIVGGHGH